MPKNFNLLVLLLATNAFFSVDRVNKVVGRYIMK